MDNKLLKKYIPYEGSEPFLFLCFADEDAKEIEPLLSRLYQRGCRVWYCLGSSESISQEAAVQARMKEAGLVVAYCTPVFLDSGAKSRMMFLQARNIPIITVDKQPTDNLTAGLREGTPHIKAYDGIREETAAELITTDGFSYAFIGDRPEPEKDDANTVLRVIGVIMTVLIVAALVFVVLVKSGRLSPKQTSVEPVEVLTLEKLPSDISELESTYPDLKKIIIPKSEAANADIKQYLDRYTVVITEGKQ